MAFWRWGTAQKKQEPLARQQADLHPHLRHLAGSGIRRAVKRYPNLAPADSSVAAFVAWMQKQDATGQAIWQTELFETYRFLGRASQFTDCVSMKQFRRELFKAGCECWESDERGEDGGRNRMVRIHPLSELPTAGRSLPNATEDKASALPLPVSAEMPVKVRVSRVRHYTATGTLGRQQNALPHPTKNKSGRALPYGSEKHSEVNQIAA